ncbi:MAG: hypothetical protein HC899_22595 [Leptolyngbyaceae cyanobacterium SM1_4_3]|nr:hypothetical protein [Leptolyngbyaceae cyanobacterium SM1_4_3]
MAYLFIVSGVLAVVDIVLSLLNNKINIDLDVLGLFIGRGLLQLNPTSHTWAIVLTRISMLLGTIVMFLFLLTSSGFELFGQTVGQAPPGLAFIVSGVLTAVVYWQHSILNNSEIKRLFGKTS